MRRPAFGRASLQYIIYNTKFRTADMAFGCVLCLVFRTLLTSSPLSVK